MRDDFIFSMRLPTSAGVTPSPQTQAPAPSASPPSGAGAVPLQCGIFFCGQPATNGDLCEPHADLMKDLRAREDYYELQRNFEDGW